jgi:hypothetical protein
MVGEDPDGSVEVPLSKHREFDPFPSRDDGALAHLLGIGPK